MAGTGRRHDRVVLDALESVEPEAFGGEVWRVTVRDRDPLRGSAAGGRWSPVGEFEALYTSLRRDGALDEIGYRLSREPAWPSLVRHDVHRLAVNVRRVLRFSDVASLAPFGVDAARYRTFDYEATQALAAAARFLGFDGLIVPSARSATANLILFGDEVLDGRAVELIESHPVDWEEWRSAKSREDAPG